MFDYKNICLEVTRECNENCEFCMRGEPEPVVMSAYTISRIFSETKHIRQLTITGGEPSLCPEVIRSITKYAKNNKSRIAAFFCSTNAVVHSQDFVNALSELYEYCYDKGMCTLTVSVDQFHKHTDKNALEKYRQLPFYKPVNEVGELPKAKILSEGRAAENGIGGFSITPKEYIYDYVLDGFTYHIGDRIYVNANGDVMLDADLSYAAQETARIGNINNVDMYYILKEHFFKIPPEWCAQTRKTIYKIFLDCDAHTIDCNSLQDTKYYDYVHSAIVAYHNILHNAQYLTMELSDFLPKDNKLVFEELPAEKDLCIGTKISFVSSTYIEPKTVIIKLVKCPIEGDCRYGRQ